MYQGKRSLSPAPTSIANKRAEEIFKVQWLAAHVDELA